MLYYLEIIDGFFELFDDEDAIKGQVFLIINPTPRTRTIIFLTKHPVSSQVVPEEYKFVVCVCFIFRKSGKTTF